MKPVLSTLVVAVALTSSAHANEPDAPLVRVRTTSNAIATAIEHATQWSATFRALLDVISRSDGLVYVEEGECPQLVPACMIHSITLAGPYRLLHVKVDARRSELIRDPADAEGLGLLGHELQHVVEVLSHPKLRTDADVASFYLREGTFASGTNLETAAAERAGIVIGEEVRRGRKSPSTPDYSRRRCSTKSSCQVR